MTPRWLTPRFAFILWLLRRYDNATKTRVERAMSDSFRISRRGRISGKKGSR